MTTGSMVFGIGSFAFAAGGLPGPVHLDNEDVAFSGYSPSSNNSTVQESVTNPKKATIRGKIRFERRFTRVSAGDPLGEPRSQEYWTLVIHTKEDLYLLNQQFNLGSPYAPEAVEVAGVTLRPGSEVELDAVIVKGAPQLFLVLNVERITLVMD